MDNEPQTKADEGRPAIHPMPADRLHDHIMSKAISFERVMSVSSKKCQKSQRKRTLSFHRQWRIASVLFLGRIELWWSLAFSFSGGPGTSCPAPHQNKKGTGVFSRRA
jgi:hypothetical protein